MAIYSLLLLFALVVGAPYWLARMAASGRYRAGLAGRLGRIPDGLEKAVVGRQVIWLHAVSVGEVMAAVRLVAELRAALPGWVVAVSTTTETGQQLARQRFDAGTPVFYLPLDFKWVVQRYLQVLRPKMVVLMESELWPRMIWQCSKAGIPLAVANARVSDRSFPRYMRLKGMWQPLLRRVALFLSQGEETARRLRLMGIPENRVRVIGNLKYDVRTAGTNPLVESMQSQLAKDAVVFVCGSTLEGEEQMLLETWPEVLKLESAAVMVLAPRHPDRFETVAKLVAERGFGVLRASEFRKAPGKIGMQEIFLLDTIGDLAATYSLAKIAFVGGSLVRKGGHNPLEAAQFGVPVLMGDSFENFYEIVMAMANSKGIFLTKKEDLAETLTTMLIHYDEARVIGENGRAVFEAQAGATAKTVTALVELLGEQVGT